MAPSLFQVLAENQKNMAGSAPVEFSEAPFPSGAAKKSVRSLLHHSEGTNPTSIKSCDCMELSASNPPKEKHKGWLVEAAS